MKKTAPIFFIIVMFAWGIYDDVSNSDKSNESQMEPTEDSRIETGIEVMSRGATDEVGLKKGNIAPDFELTTLDGETVKLSDFQGEKVMLNFWATWCGPCRSEMPDMEKFYHDKDIAILAVNLTDTEIRESDVSEFVDEYQITFPILMDETAEVADQYRINPIPTTYLIDTKGRIHNVAFGALNYERMVDEFEKMD
ncbi:Peroxiredoxin [Oceanobacillus limi]|uniref:Peroxiredoxin n=1 Tax=Oceanobacillus limi TaxID=930131 RepID=A0A1I0E0W4_9BACI|nr:TlpA disulfide reductase family protein [Oceanobacillus limi]SET38515.1 Peroxiredoxin [Oceanobacillus limi]